MTRIDQTQFMSRNELLAEVKRLKKMEPPPPSRDHHVASDEFKRDHADFLLVNNTESVKTWKRFMECYR